jgi:hypothetical protein
MTEEKNGKFPTSFVVLWILVFHLSHLVSFTFQIPEISTPHFLSIFYSSIWWEKQGRLFSLAYLKL